VRLRSDSIHMMGLSQPEISAYISRSVGHLFPADVATIISKMPGSHNYEDLKATLFQLLENALFAGRKQVALGDVERTFPDINLSEICKEAGITLSGKKAGAEKQKAKGAEKKEDLSSFLTQYQEVEPGNQQMVANG
ncbi:MAG: AAA ATPase, partial [uncultured bacterium]